MNSTTTIMCHKHDRLLIKQVVANSDCDNNVILDIFVESCEDCIQEAIDEYKADQMAFHIDKVHDERTNR